jgi:MFS family permease
MFHLEHRMSADRSESKLLAKFVAATIAVQAIVVMASLLVPVLATLVATAAGMPPYLVGYYSALIYGIAAISSLAAPDLLRRYGGIRLHQIILVLTAAALLMLLPALPVTFVVSAIVLGIAYGPINPASTAMLARRTPVAARARIFSLKQTAVPIGGALAGSLAPALAQLLGWRGALALVACACLGLALLIQSWRGELDGSDDGAVMARSSFWTPLRLVAREIELRPIAFASFAFGALQFSFSAVFPTVLAQAGWRVADAGLVLATALVVGTICRVIWGIVADRLGFRRMLAGMGALMSLGAYLAASVSASWPTVAIIALAALFGISAYCWAGIGIAETVRRAPLHLISEATAATITLTFVGALVGPSLFSSIVSATGSFGLAFTALGGLTAIATIWLVAADLREATRAGQN